MTDVLGSFNRGQRLGGGQGQSLNNLLSFIIQMERLVETKKQNKFYRELATERDIRMDEIFEFQKQQSIKAEQRREVKAAEPKEPSAGDVSYFRRRRDTKVKELGKIDADIEIMRKALDLAPGEAPPPERTWFGFGGERKEQPALDSWDRLQKKRTRKQTSLDSLRQQAEKEGIDISLGAALDL